MPGHVRKYIDEFTVESRTQQEWRWLIATAFFLGGVGAGQFIISVLQNFWAGMVVGWLIVVVGKGTAHALYLGRPLRAWRAFARPGRSWISRGMIFIAIFAVFSLLYMAPSIEVFSGLPWDAGTSMGQFLKVVSILSALGVMVYTGFLMAYCPSIPFWNTSLLPILFIVYGFMGGLGMNFITAAFGAQFPGNMKLLEVAGIGLLTLTAVILLSYLGSMFKSTTGSREAVHSLVWGENSLLFWGGAIVLGILIPLAVALSYLGVESPSTYTYLGMAAISELVGAFLFRYSLLRVGYFNPVI
ncbi:MAG: DmsC/YnfH family molybdoenzyme membrane anchor subunit [Thermodesulfobacteriota bacterium]